MVLGFLPIRALEVSGLRIRPALIGGRQLHVVRKGHIIEDVQLPLVAQGLDDVEREVVPLRGDIHVLDAVGQSARLLTVQRQVLRNPRVQGHALRPLPLLPAPSQPKAGAQHRSAQEGANHSVPFHLRHLLWYEFILLVNKFYHILEINASLFYSKRRFPST